MSGAAANDNGQPVARWAVPDSWCWVRIGELCNVVSGGTPKTSDPRNFEGGTIPWITPADLSGYSGKTIVAGRRNITSRGLEASSAQMMPAGSVLFSSRAPVGYVVIAANAVSTNQGFKSFVPPEGVLPDYLYYYLRRARPLALELSSGTTFQEISGRRARQIPVALAPSNEQRRIVAKIEELFSDLDAGVAALERARANLKRYRAAVLKAAVEGRLTAAWRADHPDVEPASVLLERILAERRRRWEEDQLRKYEEKKRKPPKGWKDKYKQPAAPDTSKLPTLPESWCWATVEQLIHYLRNGLSKKPSPEPPGHRILRINAVRPMSVDLDEVRYYSHEDSRLGEYFIENDDLLFTRYNGSVELLGVSGMVRGCSSPTLHPDKLIRVKTVLGDPMPGYVELASNVGQSRAHMVSRARTTAGQTGISGADVREMPIPLCPRDEQARLLCLLDEQLSDSAKSDALAMATLARAARLRQAILKRAFEGRLVAQDPSDEPAERLLDRIRAEQIDREKKQTTTKSFRRGKKRTENTISQRRLFDGGG